MATVLNSFGDGEDFSAESQHVFSFYRESDSEPYASKYLPPASLPPAAAPVSSSQSNGKDTTTTNGHHRTTSSLRVGEPFSALINSLIPAPQLLLHDTDEQTIYDEYGFRIDINENEQQYEVVPIVENEQAKLKWLTHLDSTYKLDVVHLPLQEQELVQKIDPKQIRQDTKIPVLLQQSFGIPSSIRAQIWMCLSGSVHKKHQAKISYMNMLKQCNNDAQLYAKQIEKDLLRTLPTNACFMNMNASGISRLRRVLRAIAWLFPGTTRIIRSLLFTYRYLFLLVDIGYCQVRICTAA